MREREREITLVIDAAFELRQRDSLTVCSTYLYTMGPMQIGITMRFLSLDMFLYSKKLTL